MVTSSFRYRAYGQTAQTNGSSIPTYLGYAGQLVDLSGLLYMRARWYDAATGRFLSRDPAIGDPRIPASLNGDSYAHLNPATNIDPTGLWCFGPGIGGSVAAGKIELFGFSFAGGSARASLSFAVCGGGSAGLNAGFVGSGGAFLGTPNDQGIVPEGAGNVSSGGYVGGGFSGLGSLNATRVSDLSGKFGSQILELGIGDLNGSVDFSHGKNNAGEDVDVITVSPPFASLGIGAAFTQMNTTAITFSYEAGGFVFSQ